MAVNAHDLVIFHKNVNRLVGKEIFGNNMLANNDSEVKHSIGNLINNNILQMTNQFEVSIQKLKK